ncbi:hypothetical protein AAE478_001234 [Parahypoxylon ruwenzoriense]
MDSRNAHPLLSPTSTLALRIKGQKTRPQLTRTLATFYRNLEEALDVRRASSIFHTVVQNDWQTGDVVDFCSNDILSFNASGVLRAEFLAELARNPDFTIGSGGSRLMDGNYPYIEQVEREIAAFHGADAGLILGSGFDANLAVWSAIPRPGDVILHDSLVHASTHEGMERSLAMQKIEFQHNNVGSFRSALVSILESQPLIKQGKRSVLVAVESVYSVDGDVCPLQDLVDVAKEMFHDRGNIEFVIDEAHSTGIIGPKGAGLVSQLGLEKEIAVRVHTYGKAMGSSGVRTRPKYLYWLYFHLLFSGYCVWPVQHPVVPVAQGRLKVSFHADNNHEDIEGLVKAIFAWVEEISDIETRTTGAKVTRAAEKVYAWMKQEGLSGFGMV